MKKYLLGLGLILMSTASYADCYIQVNSCAPGRVSAINQIFRDVLEPKIQEEPNRCLQRAREYLAYCHPGHVPALAVATAYFYNGSAWTAATVVTVTSSAQYTTNRAGAWVPLQSRY